MESAAARCEFHLAGVEHDIRRLVRAQAEQRDAGQKALVDAQRCIGELALQVQELWFRVYFCCTVINIGVVNNNKVQLKLEIAQLLSSTCLQHVVGYYCHIAHRDTNNMEWLMVTGKVEGLNCSLIKFQQLNITISTALHQATDRNRWRNLLTS